MSNKNLNYNDDESFMEGIFGCLERIETIVIEREDMETYEETIRKQVALAEQAKLKEKVAKEQEIKAKSIKNKQNSSKVNQNKSKP